MATTDDVRHGARLVHRDGREATFLRPGRAHDPSILVWRHASHSHGWCEDWSLSDVVCFQNIERYTPIQEVSDG